MIPIDLLLRSVEPLPIAHDTGVAASTSDASDVEDSVHFEHVLPHIRQCMSGHFVWVPCRERLRRCPRCGSLFINLAVENVSSSWSLPCRYSRYGCTTAFNCIDLPMHEVNCEYQPHSCPCKVISCVWKGPLNRMVDHLKSAHKYIIIMQGWDVLFLAINVNRPSAHTWIAIQSCFGRHVVITVKKDVCFAGQEYFFVIAQLIGSPEEAENYVYRMELLGNDRSIISESKSRSIEEDIATVMRNDCGLVILKSIADLFIEGGNLCFHVTFVPVSTINGGKETPSEFFI